MKPFQQPCKSRHKAAHSFKDKSQSLLASAPPNANHAPPLVDAVRFRFAALVACGLLCALALPAGAITRVVTTNADSGAGSLRAVILASVANDSIVFSNTVTSPILLTNGALNIGRNLTITGPVSPALTIDGNHQDRVFNIFTNGSSPNTTVNISYLIISNGQTNGANGTNSQSIGSPGGAAQGGGIFNQGSLNLTNCTLIGNQAIGGDGGIHLDLDGSGADGGAGSGGGIVNQGTLRLTTCTLSNNTARGGIGSEGSPHAGWHAGSGGNAWGGAIANQGTLSLMSCTVNNCSASGGDAGGLDFGNGHDGGSGNGGGIHNQDTLSLTNCTIANNSATGGQGGLGSDNSDGSPGGGGGGGGLFDQGSLSLVCCTFSGNSTRGGSGGGVGISSRGGNGGNANGGGLYQFSGFGSSNVFNTIIAGNTATGGTGGYGGNFGGNSGSDGTVTGPDVSGAVKSLGHNLIGETDGSSGWLGSDLTGTAVPFVPQDPLLLPLQAKGGTTWTMALEVDSAAVDAGDDAVLSAPYSLTTDQRGLLRKYAAHVDIGAYEINGIVTHTVTNTADSGPGTLRQTIADSVAGDAIVFAYNIAGSPITLTSGELLIGKNLTIFGPPLGMTVSGNLSSRVFHVASGFTADLSRLNIYGGRVVGAAGFPGAQGQTGGNVLGGGILNEGTLSLTNCSISGSSVVGGAGGNSSGFGNAGGSGGTGSGGGAANLGTLTLVNCTVAVNTAGGGNGGNPGPGSIVSTGGAANGGGLYNQGTLTFLSCTLGSNSVAGGDIPSGAIGGSSGTASGGNLYQQSGLGATTLRNTLIAGGTATAGCCSGGVSLGPDASGAVTSQGYNLVGKTNASSGWIATDVKGSSASPSDAKLGPLQSWVMALLSGSPAIDQGGSGGLTTDQLGQPRPVDFPQIPNAASGDGSDIGAYEVQALIFDIGLRAYDGTSTNKIAGQYPAASLPLRISKAGLTYGIKLVGTNSPDASKFRFPSSKGTRALMKLP